MRKGFLILLGLILGINIPGYSQSPDFLITSFYQATGNFTKLDLLNFNLNNFSGLEKEGVLEIHLIETSSNVPIVHLVNNRITLKNGLNVFTGTDFTEEYFANDRSKAFQLGQPLQSGSFEICIILKVMSGESVELKDCTPLKLTDDFFIHLLDPGDGEEIETLNPFLQWYTNSAENSIKFHLVLSPLAPFTNPEDALSHNLKFIELELPEKQYLYPLNAPELEYGKYYAWQVVAVKNNTVLGISESWKFTPVHKINQVESKKDCYRIIARNFNNGNYLYGDVMKFAYQNRTDETLLNYSVHDLTTGKIIMDTPKLFLKPGLNKIDLELKRMKGIREGHQYLVQIRNQNNETYKLTFNPYAKKRMTD